MDSIGLDLGYVKSWENGMSRTTLSLELFGNRAYSHQLILQPADIGLPTVNGEKLSCSQAQLGQATCLAVA